MSDLPRRRRGRPRTKPVDAVPAPTPHRRPPLPPLPFESERQQLVAELARPSAAELTPVEATGLAPIDGDQGADVAHLPVRLPGVRFALSPAQQAAAVATLQAFAKHGVTGLAANSRRTMLADWLTWLAFCRHHDRPALPVQFDDMREFLDALIDAGRKRATVEHHLYTLRQACAFYGCPDPMAQPVAKAYWRDTCRDRLVAAKRQAEGLRLDDVDRMVAGLDLAVPQQARDAALVRMAYDLLARRNELASALWTDLKLPRRGNGHGFYLVPRSKTDQEGKGTLLALSPATVAALQAWSRHAHPALPFVFQPMKVRRYRTGPQKGEVIVRPLDAGEIPKIWNRLAVAAGIDLGERWFSGHSARVGASQDVTDAGGDVALLMKLGRWRTPVQPAHYGAAGIAARAMDTRQELLTKLKQRNET